MEVLQIFNVLVSYVAAGTVTTYDDDRRATIISQFASTLAVEASLVSLNITSATGTSSRRRRLAAASVRLDFTVGGSSDGSTASNLQANVANLLGTSSAGPCAV